MTIDQTKQEILKEFDKIPHSTNEAYRDDMLRDFLSNSLDRMEMEVREAERTICRQIYIDEVDWAEWGVSDEEAGEAFDIERKYRESLKKNHE